MRVKGIAKLALSAVARRPGATDSADGRNNREEDLLKGIKSVPDDIRNKRFN